MHTKTDALDRWHVVNMVISHTHLSNSDIYWWRYINLHGTFKSTHQGSSRINFEAAYIMDRRSCSFPRTQSKMDSLDSAGHGHGYGVSICSISLSGLKVMANTVMLLQFSKICDYVDVVLQLSKNKIAVC
jgi:hypothetical protein